jgi:hypothetical protein
MHYQPGKAATVPDALSRRPDLKADYNQNRDLQVIPADRIVVKTITTEPTPSEPLERPDMDTQNTAQIYFEAHPWEYAKGHDIQRSLQKYYKAQPWEKTGVYGENCITVHGGIPYYTSPLRNYEVPLVPPDKELRHNILLHFHDSPMAGHPGIDKTFDLIQQQLAWPKLAEDIKKYVNSCLKCQQNKPIRTNRAAPLQPLEVADAPWKSISYDLIGPLPESKGKTAIHVLTVVDRFTKYTEVIGTHHDMTGDETMDLMFKQIFRQRGLPEEILSDRGTQFLNKATKKLRQALGICLKHGTAFHKESDGQTKRSNQEIEIYLRHYLNFDQNNWTDFLDTAQIALNNQKHKAHNQTPFFLVNGYHP